MNQKHVFLESEANCWFLRNKDHISHFDPNKDAICSILSGILSPKSTIAEVGCASGNRLAHLAQLYGATSFGIEPSSLAVQEAKEQHPELNIRSGTADCLPWESKSIDCLIYGFCLYLADRDDLFRIAAEGDRVLKSGGFLVVWDFCPPFPYRNLYSHRTGINSFKMDYSLLWKWSPSYTEIIRQLSSHSTAPSEAQVIAKPDDRVVTVVLHKETHYDYPDTPVYPAQNEIAPSE